MNASKDRIKNEHFRGKTDRKINRQRIRKMVWLCTIDVTSYINVFIFMA